MTSPSLSLPVCTGCGVPVFELDGQSVVLDAYLIDHGVPSDDDVGAWHVDCLERSRSGALWHTALVRSYTRVRGYASRGHTARFVVVENPRTHEVLAFDRRGPVFSLNVGSEAPRRVDGGAAFRVTTREYGLHLDDGLAREVAAGLRTRGTLPLLELAGRLCPSPRVVRPDLADDACFVFNEALAEEWMPGFVLARVAHRVFVPDELLGFVRRV